MYLTSVFSSQNNKSSKSSKQLKGHNNQDHIYWHCACLDISNKSEGSIHTGTFDLMIDDDERY